MSRDYLCSLCDKAIHWWCAMNGEEGMGHGKHYLCPECFRSPAGASEKPTQKKGKRGKVQTQLDTTTALTVGETSKKHTRSETSKKPTQKQGKNDKAKARLAEAQLKPTHKKGKRDKAEAQLEKTASTTPETSNKRTRSVASKKPTRKKGKRDNAEAQFDRSASTAPETSNKCARSEATASSAAEPSNKATITSNKVTSSKATSTSNKVTSTTSIKVTSVASTNKPYPTLNSTTSDDDVEISNKDDSTDDPSFHPDDDEDDDEGNGEMQQANDEVQVQESSNDIEDPFKKAFYNHYVKQHYKADSNTNLITQEKYDKIVCDVTHYNVYTAEQRTSDVRRSSCKLAGRLCTTKCHGGRGNNHGCSLCH